MAIVRAGALLACAAAAALYGCAGLSADTPGSVSLAGNWQLNHAASDDPQKVLAKMRDQANKIIKRQQAEMEARTGSTPPDVMGDGPPPDGGAAHGGGGQGGPQGGTHRGDPLRRSPMAAVIRNMIERGDFLTVHQSPTEFVLDYGTTRRSFTPGQHSVVSAEGGVGDQTAGWHGKSFVIKVKPQNGPEMSETYALSADGKQLIQTLNIASAELPAEGIRRVYDPASETAPRQLPTTE
jgi:hypothetical protein